MRSTNTRPHLVCRKATALCEKGIRLESRTIDGSATSVRIPVWREKTSAVANRSLSVRLAILFQDRKRDCGWVLFRMVDALCRFLEISGRGFQDSDEFLGVAVD